MKHEIKHRYTGAILYTCEAATFRETIISTVAAGADLTDADLSDANLTDATLSGADLTGANLRRANLRGATLRRANLSGADLTDADFSGATLRRADLHGANLRDANLRGADLTGAGLSGADLRRADLHGANLRGANLTPIRDDIFAVLSSAPKEAAGLLAALNEGRVDGSTYLGACACLVGTLANVAHCSYLEIEGLRPNAARPAERFFLSIRNGDTPENSQFSKLAAEWVGEWITRMQSAFGAK